MRKEPTRNDELYFKCLVSQAQDKLKNYKKARIKQFSHISIDADGYLLYPSFQEELVLKAVEAGKELADALEEMQDFKIQKESEKE